jgi:hypothetical protein
VERRLIRASLVAALLPVISFVWTVPAAAGQPGCPIFRLDETSALAAADDCGGRVEVVGARTETGQVFANADGTLTVEEYAYPQRARRADGSWAGLDATLAANPDGSFSPRASTVDLRLSGGGNGSLLTGRRAGTEVSLTWPGVLPEPTISGDTATYGDVLPGVDLLVTAHETGFSEVLVVKHRLAAKNPRLRALTFGAALSGLSWRHTDGRLEAVDGAGRAVLGASAPLMWDSSAARGSARVGGRVRGDHAGPAEGARTAAIALALHGNQITLEPSTSMLDDVTATFPLYLDPAITYTGWTMINSQFPSQSYWSFGKTDCPAPFSGECAKVGQVYGGTADYRSMWQFSTSAWHGKLITHATFAIDLLFSAFATPTATQLREVNASIGPSTTWLNNNGAWSGVVTATSSHAAHPAARKNIEFGGLLAGRLQAIADSSAPTTTWGLRAADETNSNAWKRYDARTARLIVSVNTRPNTPDTLTIEGQDCVAGPGRPVIATATPMLRGRVTDSDGHAMRAHFGWARWDGSAFVAVGSASNGPWTSGSVAQQTTTALDHGAIYTFRMQSDDSPSVPIGHGLSDVTHMPGNCEWEVDLADPAVPTVTSDLYPEDNVGCPPEGCGSVGQPGQFTFASSIDVVSFRWGLTDPPATVVAPPAAGEPVTVDWAPAVGGPTSLYVQAVDRAGRTATRAYHFTVAPTP